MARKRNIVLSVIVRLMVSVALLATGIAAYMLLVASKPQPTRSNRAGAVPRVVVMAARPVEVRRQWEGFGTARAMDTVNLPARVSATVREIPPAILSGAVVERGDLIVQLDDSDFLREEEIATQSMADVDAQLARLEVEVTSWTERRKLAEEAVTLARAEYDRVMEAMRREVAKQREVDQAKQALIAGLRDEVAATEEFDKLGPRANGLRAQSLGLDARLRLARQNVERCRIVSPLAGVLETVDVETGESLEPGQRVARIVNLGKIEIPLRLAASARTSIGVSDTARLEPTSMPGWRQDVPVARISPEDDQATRTMRVYVEVEQDPLAPGTFAPGQFVRGLVVSSRAAPRWVVPRRALDGDRILLVRDGRIVGKPVRVDFQVATAFPELGLPDEQWAVLREELEPGALVVVTPSRSLADGLIVHPVVAGEPARAVKAPADRVKPGSAAP